MVFHIEPNPLLERWFAVTRGLVSILVVLMAMATAVFAADAEDIARHGHQRAIEALPQGAGDALLQKFADEHLAPAYRDSFAPGKLMELLRDIRTAGTNAGGILFGRNGEWARVRFVGEKGETPVAFRMQPGVPYLITELVLESTAHAEHGASVPPITWESLEGRLEEEAKSGFSGAVCVVHDGKVVLNRGYGFANREKQIANDEHTIFAIGSTPIDFTRAAVLKLEDTGKLKTADPITKYLKNVPADKQAMTIDHLMSGRSGLPNFHHVRGTDADPDLTWIDRDTAVKRILGGELLFPPGTEHAHSHSAWVLLAAIVEMVSGKSYGDFVQTELFLPAGMTRTHLHEGLARFKDDEIAVGYDAASFGATNSPKYWGRTSWLVMGSGGMASTPDDLFRFFSAVYGAKVFSREAALKYGSGGNVLVGGDDRGFLCMHAEKGGDMFFLSSNAHSGPGDHASGVGKELARMVLRAANGN
jgi:CubicO group peptidase (beta-lactamase class C family)